MRAALPAPYRALLAAVIALACAAAAHGQAPDAGFRYGIPEGLDLAKLVHEPTLLASEHKSFDAPESAERRSQGFADVVAVYELPLEALLEAASDFASYSRFLPRIVESKPIGASEEPARLVYASGIKALGIEVLYRVLSEGRVDRLGGGACGVRAWMVESLDGKLCAQSNSFYFAPVTVGGRRMTFVRYYSSLSLREPGALTVKVLSMLAGAEAKAQVKALADEAGRRSRAGGIGG